MTNPIERAKASAAKAYPEAIIATRSVRGRPVVMAVEGNLIRLVRFGSAERTAARDEIA